MVAVTRRLTRDDLQLLTDDAVAAADVTVVSVHTTYVTYTIPISVQLFICVSDITRLNSKVKTKHKLTTVCGYLTPDR